MNSRFLAPINSIQDDGLWSLGVSNYQPVRELRDLCERVTPRGHDRLVWEDGGNRMVSISVIYNSLKAHCSPPLWLSFVRSKFKVAKFAFTAWLILKERLLTKDRMQNFHMHISQLCLLCGAANETHQHLFCDCSFMRSVLNACPMTVSNTWSDLCTGQMLTGNADLIRTHIAYLYISAAFYYVWMERNYRMHNPGQFSQSSIIIRRIKESMRNRLFSCNAFITAARLDITLHSFLL